MNKIEKRWYKTKFEDGIFIVVFISIIIVGLVLQGILADTFFNYTTKETVQITLSDGTPATVQVIKTYPKTTYQCIQALSLHWVIILSTALMLSLMFLVCCREKRLEKEKLEKQWIAFNVKAFLIIAGAS